MNSKGLLRYSELIALRTFEERFAYLRLANVVGDRTFGFDRDLNQQFYKSREWKDARRRVLLRDSGRDLGCIGHEIGGLILVHHMNPISVDDILNRNPIILDPQFLICASEMTHQAIHYGDERLKQSQIVKRFPGDTKIW